MKEWFNLEDKVAVVVGGTSGIGRAIATGYAQAGANVVASSRRLQQVEETAQEIATLGSKTLALTCDVQDSASLVDLCEAVVEDFGTIDILVVSSGVICKVPSVEMSEEDLVRVVDINLNGTFRANQVFGRHMIAQKRGAIINIASVAATRSILEMAPYAASKAGVISLTKTLGSEWAKFNVRVNAIAPGPFKTPLNVDLLKIPGRAELALSRLPMNRFGELEELVGTAIYLGTDASSYVTGTTIPVEGGFLALGF